MITVCLFASLREAVGEDRLEFTHRKGMTVADVFSELRVGCPKLEPLGNVVRAAVNQSYSDWETELIDGDEVAFFPPVSGGRQ